MHISKSFTFEAAHVLPRHPGKCSREHGHSYKLEVEVHGPVQEETQFIVDYGDLDVLVKPIVELFDHRHLNAYIKYPSAENICTHIAHLLLPMLQRNPSWEISRLIVRLQETAKTSAVWDSLDREDMDRIRSLTGEWRSPDVPIPMFPAEKTMDGFQAAILAETSIARAAFEKFLAAQTRVAQYTLYRDSLRVVTNFNDELSGKAQ